MEHGQAYLHTIVFCDTRCSPEARRNDFSRHSSQYDFTVAGTATIDFFINSGKRQAALRYE